MPWIKGHGRAIPHIRSRQHGWPGTHTTRGPTRPQPTPGGCLSSPLRGRKASSGSDSGNGLTDRATEAGREVTSQEPRRGPAQHGAAPRSPRGPSTHTQAVWLEQRPRGGLYAWAMFIPALRQGGGQTCHTEHSLPFQKALRGGQGPQTLPRSPSLHPSPLHSGRSGNKTGQRARATRTTRRVQAARKPFRASFLNNFNIFLSIEVSVHERKPEKHGDVQGRQNSPETPSPLATRLCISFHSLSYVHMYNICVLITIKKIGVILLISGLVISFQNRNFQWLHGISSRMYL